MKKIRDYEVEVNEQGIATRMWANDKRVYPYAITKYGNVLQENIKFSTLKDGIYKERIFLF